MLPFCYVAGKNTNIFKIFNNPQGFKNVFRNLLAALPPPATFIFTFVPKLVLLKCFQGVAKSFPHFSAFISFVTTSGLCQEAAIA
jgi:hypothetical protein